MQYRRVREDDYKQIVALQNENLSSNLTEEEKKGGFLSTQFTIEQFRAMDEALGLVVAVDGIETVTGYLAATTLAFNECMPVPAAMIRHCSQVMYRGAPLTSYRLFVANPVCIAKKYRGMDVFVPLCEKLLELFQRDHQLALAFISAQNHRSLHACQKKMHMQIVSEFTVGTGTFHLLVRDFEIAPDFHHSL